MFRVFLAHSTSNVDRELVDAISEGLRERGIDCYVAEESPEPGTPVTKKIEKAILSCDVVVAVMTSGGAGSGFVNQEVSWAKAKGKLVIPIVEVGVKLEAWLHGLDSIPFTREEMGKAFDALEGYVENLKLGKEDQEKVVRLCVIILAIMLAFFLLWALSRKSGT